MIVENGSLLTTWSSEWSQWEELHGSIEMKTLLDRSNTILKKQGKGSGKSKMQPGLGTAPFESARFTRGLHTSHVIQPTLTRQNSNTGMERTEFHIFAKNAHVHSQTKFAELLVELAYIEWDIILLFETRYAGGIVVFEGGHHMFASSEPTVAAGVATFVNCRHARNIKYSHAPSSRICFADMMMEAGVIRFVATYTPHMGYSNHDLYRYYDQLT